MLKIDDMAHELNICEFMNAIPIFWIFSLQMFDVVIMGGSSSKDPVRVLSTFIFSTERRINEELSNREKTG